MFCIETMQFASLPCNSTRSRRCRSHPVKEKTANGSKWLLALQLVDLFGGAVQRDIVTINALISACEKGHQWNQVPVMELVAAWKCMEDP